MKKDVRKLQFTATGTNDPRFWMVFNMTTGGLPKVRHANCAKARREAIRMARLHRGHRFVVLEAYWSVFLTPEASPKEFSVVQFQTVRDKAATTVKDVRELPPELLAELTPEFREKLLSQ